ncbi:hypothetical protein JNW91_01020 [Micromonospora sp. STR1_7]|uniref:Uncharacterized protein n=1 Tax=Micromonospora parastrephiae TaxID=2806101 RepID=A0ABS1XMU1_9ACTN|nr:hypothetical protein [Micromonospora parastrephiae]MBM0230582.1 hypothetical protein [Micromonospora parastrephiae]
MLPEFSDSPKHPWAEYIATFSESEVEEIGDADLPDLSAIPCDFDESGTSSTTDLELMELSEIPGQEPDIADPLVETTAMTAAEATDTPERTDLPEVPERTRDLPDQLVETAATTAAKAVLWKAMEVTADALAPGSGLVVRVTKIIIDCRGAVKSYEQGDGILLNVPLLDLPGRDFSASLRLRIFADNPSPGLPADLAIDYVSADGRLDRLNLVESADASPIHGTDLQGHNLDLLFRHPQRLVPADTVTYLHQPTRTGWIVVQPLGAPPRCEAWFTYKLSLTLNRPTETEARCTRCGRVAPAEHVCLN